MRNLVIGLVVGGLAGWVAGAIYIMDAPEFDQAMRHGYGGE